MGTAILIVEDNDDDFAAIMRAFGLSGLQNPVQRCNCGDKALACLRDMAESGTGKPGLLLLDLNMPGTDGRDVLRMIKSDPRLKQIPVIVMTTSIAREDIQRCYDAGADSYLFKPLNMDGLAQSIARLKERGLAGFSLDFGKA